MVCGFENIDSMVPPVGPSQEWTLRKKDFDAAFDLLPLASREATTMVLIEGNSYEDAAEKSGCALGTVKSRVNRARKYLADRLGDPLERAAEI
jgi:RNA polymerase sigma-70 factor (ECF subfamily)